MFDDPVSWVPCQRSMVCPRVADGETASKTLNKKPRTNDKGWTSSLEVGRGANNLSA
jgi:hypothetical protein